MGNRLLAAIAVAILSATAGAAGQFAAGDWAASRIGHLCYVFTTRAAPDTSGALVFRFENNGFNAGFGYDYIPWPGETDAPWSPDDFVVLSIDEESTWLGDEMFAQNGPTGYSAHLTDGFVSDVIAAFSKGEHSVSFSMERASQGETWLYGRFSLAGFRESMAEAGSWCAFDPIALPQS